MDATVRTEILKEVQVAVQNSQTNILNSLTTLLDSRLEGFSKSLQSSQKAIADTQMAKIDQTLSDSYRFKKRGNEEQHKANNKVFIKLKEASSELSKEGLTGDNVNNAREKIAEGIEFIKNRQKLIKLADSSDAGWRAVDEYIANPIADDSDDERKIYKAQTRADAKLKKDKAKRKIPIRAESTVSSFSRSTSDVQKKMPDRPGRCFRCNREGHWRRECTEGVREKRSEKISKILLFDINRNDSVNVLRRPIVCETESHSNIKSSFNEVTTSADFTIDSKNEVVSPAGQLRSHIDKWLSIGANDYIIDVVKNGYKIPFLEMPCRIELDNNKSAKDHPDFVLQEIEKLLEKKCISKVSYIPHVVNPLTVAGHTRKLRLVLDARHVNPCIFKFKYKYEDASTARQLFKKGDFCFQYDLKSAYHHVEIAESDTTYLGFKWGCEYYVFNVLPFGLSTSGFIFSKVMREVVKYWRNDGINIVMYLDDGLGGASSVEECKRVSQKVLGDLESFGFLLAHEKCNWEPSQNFVWLGFSWDLAGDKVMLTETRVEKLKFSIQSLLDQIDEKDPALVKVRFLASIVGQIISAQAVVGNDVRLRTRFMYDCILGRASWNASILVSENAIEELNFWLSNIDLLNQKGDSLSQLTDSQSCDVDLFCDASDEGFGGHLTLIDSLDESIETSMFGSWSDFERDQSSTWRELEAVDRVVRNSVSSLSGRSVKIHSDNKNVAQILKVGSRKMHLQDIAMSVHDVCDINSIEMSSVWIPRAENVKADILSRMSDCDDWGIQQWVFDYLSGLWGVHTCDRFACDYNTKCVKFNSKFYCKGTSGIDAFKQDWSNDNNWLVPPPSHHF